jgi:hypothetical protein
MLQLQLQLQLQLPTWILPMTPARNTGFAAHFLNENIRKLCAARNFDHVFAVVKIHDLIFACFAIPVEEKVTLACAAEQFIICPTTLE